MSNDTSFLNIAARWLLALTLTGVLIVFFLVVSAVQATSESAGQRILRRAVAVTANVDAILPQIESDLHHAALQGDADPVRVPNFPIPVDISKAEAARLEGPELRARILDESARRLYEDGSSAWAASDESGQQHIKRVSTAGALHRGFGLITHTWHTVFLALAIVSGLIALLLTAFLLVSVPPFLRLTALSGVTLTASLLSLAAAVALRFALRTSETNADPFEKRLIDIGVDTLWVFIRNYLILSILGFAVLAVASLALWLQSRASTRGIEGGIEA